MFLPEIIPSFETRQNYSFLLITISAILLGIAIYRYTQSEHRLEIKNGIITNFPQKISIPLNQLEAVRISTSLYPGWISLLSDEKIIFCKCRNEEQTVWLGNAIVHYIKNH